MTNFSISAELIGFFISNIKFSNVILSQPAKSKIHLYSEKPFNGSNSLNIRILYPFKVNPGLLQIYSQGKQSPWRLFLWATPIHL